MTTGKKKIEVSRLRLYYGETLALKDVSLEMAENTVMALIGPSGCGKSTFLKTINRMNDLIESVHVEGEVLVDGEDIYGPDVDVVHLRKRVGMVFQRPTPCPRSIYENIAYGPRIQGLSNKRQLDEGPMPCGKVFSKTFTGLHFRSCSISAASTAGDSREDGRYKGSNRPFHPVPCSC